MLAVDFQNTNQVNSHVLYSDSSEKKITLTINLSHPPSRFSEY